MAAFDPKQFLSIRYNNPALDALIAQVCNPPPSPSTSKFPPKMLYSNYHSLGLSLSFLPVAGYQIPPGDEQLDKSKLECDAVDLYNLTQHNEPPTKSTGVRKKASPFSPFPLPILLSPSQALSDSRESSKKEAGVQLVADSDTTGAVFVKALGEPTRKGGGNAAGIGIWMEWTSLGIMVELNSKGIGAWDRGGESTWSTITFFR